VIDPVHYRHALDTLPQLVWMAGADGTVEYLNRRCAEYTGLPIDDLLGWDWSWIVHPSDLPETLRVWNESIRAGTPHTIEFRLRRNDGEYRWFLVRAEPVRDADGRVLRWVGTCTDIDETRRLADQLRLTRMMFRALVERGEDGFALVGADGTVRYANPAAGRLLDFSSDDLAGTDLWGSVYPADRQEVCGWLERVLANPGQRLAVTVRFTQRGGAPRWMEVMGTNLLPDPDVRAVTVQLRAMDGTQSPPDD
jgi:PAS domain S-box-containing protein